MLEIHQSVNENGVQFPLTIVFDSPGSTPYSFSKMPAWPFALEIVAASSTIHYWYPNVSNAASTVLVNLFGVKGCGEFYSDLITPHTHTHPHTLVRCVPPR